MEVKQNFKTNSKEQIYFIQTYTNARMHTYTHAHIYTHRVFVRITSIKIHKAPKPVVGHGEPKIRTDYYQVICSVIKY